MNVLDDVLDALGTYRDGYLRRGFSIPLHEIVIRSDKFVDLMADERVIQYVDHGWEERNFAGAIVIIESTAAPHVKIRDRTMKQRQ